MSKKDTTQHVFLIILLIILLPFVISAACEFLPRWVALPSILVGSMLWLGTCALIMDKEENKHDS